ncbi:Wzy polymerase domain-containing protein [Amphritea sp. HPY]|uniref:PglL family O-oligosaccharyltransferase n=1 Tax=Amphritea sp. HPY TaxID=3421652 RepID=UPI003D7CF6C8
MAQPKPDSLLKIQRSGLILLAVLFLPASLFFQPNLGGEGLSITFNSTVWITASLIICCATFAMLKLGSIEYPTALLALLAMPVGIIASGFIVENFLPVEWVFRQLYILAGFFFLLALFQFRFTFRQTEQLLLIILIAGIVHALYAISQIFWPQLFSQFRAPRMGWAPYGIFQQINLLASFQASALLIGVYLLSRPIGRSQSLSTRLIILLAILLSSFLVFYAGSRVGLLAAILGLLLITCSRYRQLLNNRKLLIIALILFIGAGFAGKEGLERSGKKFQDIITNEEQGVAVQGASSRKNIYAISLDLFLQAPIAGHGIGSFQKVWHEKKVEYLAAHPNALFPSQRLSHPHNELFFWLIEGGILAIAGILITALTIMVAAFNCGWRRGLAYLALLCPILLHTQVELPFYISNIHWFLLLTLLFIILRHRRKQSKLRLSRAATVTIATTSITVLLLTSLFMIQALAANSGIVRFLQSRMSQPAHLETALENFYFRDDAELYLMRTLLLRDLNNQSNDFAPKFIEWAEPVIEYRPIEQLYIDLARAYLAIGEKKQAGLIIDRGIAIYPTSNTLNQAQTKIYEVINKPESTAINTVSAAAPTPQPAPQDQ